MDKSIWATEFEFEAQKFQENSLAAQVKSETLHPFDRELFMSTLREQLLSFYSDIKQGYSIIIKTVLELSSSGIPLAGMLPIPSKSVKYIQHLFPTNDLAKQFSKKKLVTQWVEEGKPLFQTLGLTPEAVAVMYEAACYLLKEGRDEDARASFRLLLVLAPHMADFWIGYGVAQLRLSRHEEAIDSLDRATVLDPQSLQALLLLCRSLVEIGRRGEADARLGARLDDAARRGNRDRYEVLQTARFELTKFTPEI